MNRRKAINTSLILTGGALINKATYARAYDNIHKAKESKVQPFKVHFRKEKIDDLYGRINNMKWPEMPFQTGWSHGMDDQLLRDLVKYWANNHDWYEQQDKLNELKHFKASIDGEEIHYVHYKGVGQPKPYPLMLFHGWPGSFLEFSKAAPLLVEEGFDLVVPSIPGFIFSDLKESDSCYYKNIAEKMHKLMQLLGYDQYGVTGGDWGWLVARELALKHSENVAKLLLGSPMIKELPEKGRNTQENEYLARNNKRKDYGMAYHKLQSTKPQTIAYGFQDSPVGFLAWILEKYWEWSYHEDDLWKVIDKDFQLNTVTLYWLSDSIFSSSLTYYINNKYGIDWKTDPISVPTKYTSFSSDPFGAAPESFIDHSIFTNFVEYSIYEKGGHFPAIENPETWTQDLLKFFT